MMTPRRDRVRHDPETGLCLRLGQEYVTKGADKGSQIDHVCVEDAEHDGPHMCRCHHEWITTTKGP
jgi:hypothetical protein